MHLKQSAVHWSENAQDCELQQAERCAPRACVRQSCCRSATRLPLCTPAELHVHGAGIHIRLGPQAQKARYHDVFVFVCFLLQVPVKL